ncbi:MAG: hypothetical protein WCV80_03240 [Candidatus Paceibacterota bacterium]|jgi:hypothetical protein
METTKELLENLERDLQKTKEGIAQTKVEVDKIGERLQYLDKNIEELETHMRYFNHPERNDDEIFLANVSFNGFWGSAHITKRIGNPFGDKTEPTYPMFIKISEATEKHILKSLPQ